MDCVPGPQQMSAFIADVAPAEAPNYHMLKNGLAYRDLGADHFSSRDRYKAILRLVRRINDLGCEVHVTPQAA
jgi:transposase